MNPRIERYLILVLYTLCFFPMLLNKGIYWDDWTLYNMRSEIILDAFKQSGNMWNGPFHVLMQSLPFNTTVYKILIFASYLLAALCLNEILKRISQIDDYSRLILVLLFISFPVNFAKIAEINSPAALKYFLFFCALWLVAKYVETRWWIFRLISLFFFFLSFGTSSFLVLYSLVLIFIFYMEHKKLTIALISRKYIDFITIPVIYWLVKSVYYKPYGLYEGYNELSFSAILNPTSLFSMLKSSFQYSFIDILTFTSSMVSFNNIIYYLLVIVLFTFILLKTYRKREMPFPKWHYALAWIIASACLFIISVFPYIAVQKIPMLADWESRHQLLIPLGASFFIYYCVRTILGLCRTRPIIKHLTFSVILLLFINANLNVYIGYQKDWYKQVSLLNQFKSSEIIQHNTTFVINDQMPGLNMFERVYRFYEYSGMFKLVFNDETRFGILSTQYNQYDSLRSYMNEHYNLKDYKPEKANYEVIIRPGSYSLTTTNLIKLKYNEFFNSAKYDSLTKDIVSLEYNKI